ncbi:zinc finger MYM-type protein 1-like [Quercus lobata]|uniref:zinc finger MYM-type protein 1-like n=1 Tax=Quercus lobata TaxID=97700 RepID=UPI0012474CBB|nr:zinc finger MYM-type protein 1-like [Quercus lobata]
MPDEHPSKCPKLQFEEIDRDLGSCKQICEFPINKQDEIRRAYLIESPYQPKNIDYPYNDDTHRRRFQPSWFDSHKDWLEYTPSMDAIYCLTCYLFSKKPIGRPRSDAFISTGFNNWKKVKDGMNCPLIRHVGKEPNSLHKIVVKCCEDLKNYSRHIDKLIEKQTSKELENNRLRLKTSIECARWLAFQACAFRGHDESLDSKNRGNFIKLIKFTSTFNDKVASVVLENAPGNAKYTLPTIQKENLHILASNVQNAIREEIGDAKFCILVDEARDESKREKMAIILRFVDKEGFIKERFFHVVHVRDTTALTLQNEICAVLSHYNLHIENIRGQECDGASNMRGELNGLQVFFLKDYLYAYVHCMAHRLQLALVTASREVKDVHQFFDHSVNIINIFVGSSKHNDELQHAQVEQVENMIASNEIETGRGANQIGTLQRAGDTRWGSHFQSICSLIKMFDATCKVINTIPEEGANYKQRGDAEGAYQVLISFEFILILHLMKEIMGITNVLCQALQQHSQDLLNAMHLVSTTKSLIQKLRDYGWEALLASVISFCEQHEIDIPDMNTRYTKGRGRYCCQDDDLTMEYHFRIGIFTVAIDFQLQELKSRFCELITKLVILSLALNPKDAFRLFKIVHICNLVKKYYPQDFT